MAQTTGDWRRVDPNAVQQLYTAFMTDSMAPACVRVVENRLLSAGILFTDRSYTAYASDEFSRHINVHFVRFVRDALQQLVICGFCFFVIDDTVPRVVPVGMADVRWRRNVELYSIEVAAFNADNEPDPRVLSIVDTAPDVNGNLVSQMASYLRTRSLQDTFMRFALQADQLNADPPIYTYSSTDRMFDEHDLESYGTATRAAAVSADMRKRSEIAMSMHEFNELMVRKLNSRDSGTVARERTDKASGVAHFDASFEDRPQRVYPLPLDARVANAPRAAARMDIVSIQKHFEVLACVTFGVNAESVGADTRSGGHLGAATLERVNTVTAETTDRWARVFEPVLVQVYNLVWGDSKPADRRRRKTNFLAENDFTVVFPSTLPSALIEQLFKNRVLTYEAYRSYVARIVQLPVTAFEEQPPEPGA